MHSSDARFLVIVPVKPTSLGKSRLADFSGSQRESLARAFALDTLAACAAAERAAGVVACTDDQWIGEAARDLGATQVADAGGGLNGALRTAWAESRANWPTCRPAVFCADLPALRADDVDRVLAAMPVDRPGFLADADGVGTTSYAAPDQQFDPRFGPGSAAAHLASGAEALTLDAPRAACDVDDPLSLAEAIRLGVGPRTLPALQALRLVASPH